MRHAILLILYSLFYASAQYFNIREARQNPCDATDPISITSYLQGSCVPTPGTTNNNFLIGDCIGNEAILTTYSDSQCTTAIGQPENRTINACIDSEIEPTFEAWSCGELPDVSDRYFTSTQFQNIDCSDTILTQSAGLVDICVPAGASQGSITACTDDCVCTITVFAETTCQMPSFESLAGPAAGAICQNDLGIAFGCPGDPTNAATALSVVTCTLAFLMALFF